MAGTLSEGGARVKSRCPVPRAGVSAANALTCAMTMTKNPSSSQYRWHHELKQLFVLGIERHRSGELTPEKHFNESERAYLATIGLTAHEFFDFVDDHVRYDGDPDWEMTLLVNAVRRDYFLTVQQGNWSTNLVSMDALPAKDAKLDGIPWLPRIIKKARSQASR